MKIWGCGFHVYILPFVFFWYNSNSIATAIQVTGSYDHTMLDGTLWVSTCRTFFFFLTKFTMPGCSFCMIYYATFLWKLHHSKKAVILQWIYCVSLLTSNQFFHVFICNILIQFSLHMRTAAIFTAKWTFPFRNST